MVRIPNVVTFILFSLIMFSISEAQPADLLFKQGVELYGQKKYEDALQAFLSIEKEGRSGFELYYNIGNCYYRLQKPGWAIYYYEKARQINPTDPDLEYNINLVSDQIPGIIKVPPKFFLVEWWDTFFNAITIRHVLLATVLLLLLINLSFILRILFIKHPVSVYFTQLMKMLSIALIIVILLAIAEYKHDLSRDFAIVTEDKISVRSEPFEESNILFYVVGGQKAVIKRMLENKWVELMFPDGNSGWVLSNQIRSLK